MRVSRTNLFHGGDRVIIVARGAENEAETFVTIYSEDAAAWTSEIIERASGYRGANGIVHGRERHRGDVVRGFIKWLRDLWRFQSVVSNANSGRRRRPCLRARSCLCRSIVISCTEKKNKTNELLQIFTAPRLFTKNEISPRYDLLQRCRSSPLNREHGVHLLRLSQS